MKQKLTLLLIALFTTMGAWATDVTVISSSVPETTYGSFSSGTFTTNGESGLGGLTVSGVTGVKGTSFAYGSSLAFESTQSGTITLTAPEGYTILGYSLFARSNTYSVSYTLTPAAGGSAVTTNTSGVTLVTSGVNSRTTTIAYSAGSSNHFYIPSLVISVKADAAEPVDVVYKEVYNGVVKVTNDAVTQAEGEAPSLPIGLRRTYCTYKYYTTEECTGDELAVLTPSTTEVYVKVTFTPPFTLSSGFDGAIWYYLYFNRDTKKYWQMDPGTSPYPNKTSKPSVSEAIWAFTGDPYDGIKVMNARAGDGYYLKKTGTSSGNAITMQKGGDFWAIGEGNGGFYLKQEGTSVFIHDYSSNLAVWNSGSAANDKGSAIVVEAASPIKVTYKLTYNGNVISSYTKDLYELVGATATAPFDWVLPPYCSLGSCSPATIEAETTEVTVPLNWNGPFAIASDYASAVWHYVSIGGAWTIYNGSALAAADSRLAAIESGDGALWAFVGDPTSFKMYNKLLGSTYKLNVGDNLVMSTSDKYAPLTVTEVNSTSFYLANDGSFYLGYDETKDNKFPYVSPADSRALMTAISSYCGQALSDLSTYASEHAVGQYFGVKQADVDNVEAFILSYPKMTQAEYEESFPALFSSYITTYYPPTGYYRIRNNGTGNYLAYGTPTASGTTRPAGLIATSNNTDAASIIKLTGSNGTYKLTTQGLNIQSQTASNVAFPGTDAEGVDFVFNVSTPGVVSITNAASAVNSDKDGSLHEATDGWDVHGVVNWSASAANSKWVIEEATSVTVAMHSDGAGTPTYYATFCAPFSYTVSDATAYTLAKSDNVLTPTEAEVDGAVPAGTPVLLQGTSSTATLTISGTDYAATPITSDLTGTYLAKTINGGSDYVLGINGGVVGFYHWNSNDLGANRAYVVGGGGSVKGYVLNFDDDATAIEMVNGQSSMVNGQPIYNLAGQRISKMQKGINIVNGKKIMVK